MTQVPSSPYPPLFGLYAITPDEPDTDKLLASVLAVLAGGCRWIQYRHKTTDAPLRQQQAKALNELCQAHGAALLINDDVELAQAIGAAGVHLGKDDISPMTARKMLGDTAIIGISCYQDVNRAAQFARASQTGQSNCYLAFGAAYPSLTKPDAALASPEIFHAACHLPLPVCAIGGITLENARPLMQMGVKMVAVIHDIFSRPAAAITARVAAYQNLFAEFSHA